MRGTNGPMDVITRAEFDHSMKDVLTKTDFELRLADTKSELVSAMKQAVKESIDDLKVDLSAQIEEKATRANNLLQLETVKRSDLKDAKNEILATMRRNISEAIDPLKADLHKMGGRVDKLGEQVDRVEGRVDKLGGQVDQMGERLHKMGARVDEMHATFKSVADGHKALDEKLTSLGDEMRETWKRYERTLDRHDADLYKLRQAGVLQ